MPKVNKLLPLLALPPSILILVGCQGGATPTPSAAASLSAPSTVAAAGSGADAQAGMTPQSGVVIVTEIMPNPSAVPDEAGEWFEVFNDGADALDINGWTIRDQGPDPHIIDNGGPLLVPPKGFLVLGNNADRATNGGIGVDYEYTGIVLNNRGDEIELVDPSGVIADTVTYTGAFVSPEASANLDPSAFDAIANDFLVNWCLSSSPLPGGGKGTPGRGNDECEPRAIIVAAAEKPTLSMTCADQVAPGEAFDVLTRVESRTTLYLVTELVPVVPPEAVLVSQTGPAFLPSTRATLEITVKASGNLVDGARIINKSVATIMSSTGVEETIEDECVTVVVANGQQKWLILRPDDVDGRYTVTCPSGTRTHNDIGFLRTLIPLYSSDVEVHGPQGVTRQSSTFDGTSLAGVRTIPGRRVTTTTIWSGTFDGRTITLRLERKRVPNEWGTVSTRIVQLEGISDNGPVRGTFASSWKATEPLSFGGTCVTEGTSRGTFSALVDYRSWP